MDRTRSELISRLDVLSPSLAEDMADQATEELRRAVDAIEAQRADYARMGFEDAAAG